MSELDSPEISKLKGMRFIEVAPAELASPNTIETLFTTITQAKQSNQRLDESLSHLFEQIEQNQNRLMSQRRNIHALDGELKKKKHELEDLKRKNAEVLESTQALTLKRNDIHNKLKTLQADKEAFELKVHETKELETKIKSSQAAIDSLKKENQELKAQNRAFILRFKDHLRLLSRRIVDLESQLEQEHSTNSELRSHLQKKGEIDQENKRLIADLRQELTFEAKRNKKFSSENERWQEQVKNLNMTVAAQSGDLSDLKAVMTKKIEQLDRLNKWLRDDFQNQSLKDLHAFYKEQVDEYKSKITEYKTRNQEYQNKITEISNRFIALESRYRTIKSEYESRHSKQNSDLNTLQSKVDDYQRQLTISGLQKQNLEAELKRTEAAQEAAKLKFERDLKIQDEKLVELESRLEKKAEEVLSLKNRSDSTLSTKQSDSYPRELEEYQSKITDLTSRLKSLKNEKEESEQKLNSQISLISQRSQQKDVELTELRQKSEQLEAQKTENSSLQDAIKHLSKEKDQATDDLKHREAQLNSLESEKTILESKLAELQEDRTQILNRHSSEVEGLQNEISRLSKIDARLRKKLKERSRSAAREHRRLSNEIDQIRQSRESEMSRVASGEEHIQKLQRRLQELDEILNLNKRQFEDTVKRLTTEADEQKVLCKELLGEKEHLYTKVESLQLELESARGSLNEKDSTCLNLQEKLSVLEGQRDHLTGEIAELKDLVSKLEVQNFDLNKQIKSHSAAEQNDLDRGWTKIKSRENQLKAYSRSLDKEKQDLRKKVEEFVGEMKSSVALNPLKQYLHITEKEISKVEIDLGKLSYLSRERPQLEEILERLIRQRDSVKSMLEDLEGQMQRKLKNIHTIFDRSLLMPPPPLPPSDL